MESLDNRGQHHLLGLVVWVSLPVLQAVPGGLSKHVVLERPPRGVTRVVLDHPNELSFGLARQLDAAQDLELDVVEQIRVEEEGDGFGVVQRVLHHLLLRRVLRELWFHRLSGGFALLHLLPDCEWPRVGRVLPSRPALVCDPLVVEDGVLDAGIELAGVIPSDLCDDLLGTRALIVGGFGADVQLPHEPETVPLLERPGEVNGEQVGRLLVALRRGGVLVSVVTVVRVKQFGLCAVELLEHAQHVRDMTPDIGARLSELVPHAGSVLDVGHPCRVQQDTLTFLDVVRPRRLVDVIGGEGCDLHGRLLVALIDLVDRSSVGER